LIGENYNKVEYCKIGKRYKTYSKYGEEEGRGEGRGEGE
jgi:hypothetical protein